MNSEMTNPNAKLSEEETCLKRFAYVPVGGRFYTGQRGTVVFVKINEDQASPENDASYKATFALGQIVYFASSLRAEEGIGETKEELCASGAETIPVKTNMTEYPNQSDEGKEVAHIGYMRHSGPWRCAHCPHTIPYDPDWGVMSGAMTKHFAETHNPKPSSDEGKPTESAQQDEQRYERIMTVARHVQLSEDQVKRLLGCLLMIGLELTEVDPEAAPSTPVSAPQEHDFSALDDYGERICRHCRLRISEDDGSSCDNSDPIPTNKSVGQEETKK